MVKLIYFIQKKPNLSVEDFQRYWRLTHADVVRRVPGLRRCVQCHTLPSGYNRPTPPPLDGVEELTFGSLADLASAEASSAGRAVTEDLAHFVDTHRLKRIVAQEILIKAGEISEGMVKNIELVNRKPGMPLTDFHRYWEEFHGPLAAKIEMIRRYVQSHTHPGEYEKEKPPDYDGIAETWFTDTAAMRLSASTPEYKAVRADEENFLAGELPFIITREVRIVWP